MNEVLLGLFSGVAFGYVIQRVGATDADKLNATHLFEDTSIAQFMLLVVAITAVGLWGLEAAGIAKTRVLPTSLVATGLAGILFGVGWGVSGYCPGTTWAAAGEGRMDAVFALLGGLFGTAAFAQFHETLIPLLYLPTNLGQITLADWFGGTAAVWLLAVVFVAAAWVLGRLTAERAYSA